MVRKYTIKEVKEAYLRASKKKRREMKKSSRNLSFASKVPFTKTLIGEKRRKGIVNIRKGIMQAERKIRVRIKKRK